MMDLLKSITRQEWKFWAKVLVGLIVITSVSRIFAVIATPEGQVWTGRTYFPPGDHFVYISYIEQIKNGANILQDLYSAKGETAPMINLFWMSLGYLARFTGLSSLAIMHLSRVLLMPAMLLALYLLIAYFFKNILERKIAFLLSVFGGGVGVWVYPLTDIFTKGREIVDYIPIDFNVSEAFVFLSSYYSAHFVASLALFFFIILASLMALEKKKLKYAVYAGCAGFLLLNFHPFSFVVFGYIFAAYFLYLLWKDRSAGLFLFKYFLIFGIIAMPAAIYHLYMMSTPWWQNQIWNSNTEAPNIVYVVFGYGLLLFFSILSVYKVIKKEIKVSHAPFLIIWFLGQLALIFLPISVQRRFLEGYDVLLAILATPFIMRVIQKRPWLIKGRAFPALVFIVLFSLSFVLVVYFDFSNYTKRVPLIYISRDNLEAMEALREYTAPDDLILADLYSGNTIPGIAMRHVFAGHGAETINFKYKLDALTRFGKSTDYDERLAILKNNKIDYLFYDPNWNWAWNPEDEPSLEKIYEKGQYRIYKVR